MDRYLGFRLYGTMASWGTIAVGEERQTWSYPTKSAIVGLVAAGLGVRRRDWKRQRELAEALELTVVVMESGMLLRDYHTVQVSPQRRKIRYRTRKAALESGELETILSSRSYMTDGDYLILLRLRSPISSTLEDIGRSLAKPAFVQYLGRKACPPCLPMQPQTIEAEDVRSAITKLRAGLSKALVKPLPTGEWYVYWEPSATAGMESLHTGTRNDFPEDRERWLFSKRRENFSVIRPEGE